MRQHDSLSLVINDDCKLSDATSPEVQTMSNGVELSSSGSLPSTSVLPPMPKGLEPYKQQLAGHKFGDKDNSYLYGSIYNCPI